MPRGRSWDVNILQAGCGPYAKFEEAIFWCLWTNRSLKIIKQADKSSSLGNLTPAASIVTSAVDGILACITLFHVVDVCKAPVTPPVVSLLCGWCVAYPYARYTVRKKYNIESPICLECYYSLCLPPCFGLAQLRAQLDGDLDAGGSGGSGEGGAEDDEDGYDNGEEDSTMIVSRRGRSTLVNAKQELGLTLAMASNMGTSSNEYQVGYALGWPSGFPEHWFQEYRWFDERSVASQMLKIYGEADKVRREEEKKRREFQQKAAKQARVEGGGSSSGAADSSADDGKGILSKMWDKFK